MNQHNDHRLTHVAERDVDLLLIEEFCCSEAFFNWFAEQLRPVVGDAELQFVQARHSVSMSGEGSGETDIEVIALAKSAGSTCRLAILIEDKVDAEFTERQPDRYALRARQLVTGGICDRTILVLLAPAEYAGQGDDQFDVRIPYERVIDYFRSREDSLSGELMRAVSIGGGCWNKHSIDFVADTSRCRWQRSRTSGRTIGGCALTSRPHYSWHGQSPNPATATRFHSLVSIRLPACRERRCGMSCEKER